MGKELADKALDVKTHQRTACTNYVRVCSEALTQ